MTAAWIVEAVDVVEDRHLSMSACVPCVPPEQLGLDGFEERFNSGVVIAIALSTHGYFEAVLAQDLLIVVRTILTTADALLSVKLRFAFDLSVCVDVR